MPIALVAKRAARRAVSSGRYTRRAPTILLARQGMAKLEREDDSWLKPGRNLSRLGGK